MIYFITRILYLFTHFVPPEPPKITILFSVSMNFASFIRFVFYIPHTSEITQYLPFSDLSDLA